MTIAHEVTDGVAEVVMSNPPVNALDVARLVRARAPDPRAWGTTRRCAWSILAAEGQGFNAGVDIKEMQRAEGHEALLGANRGCYAAFAAVYECAVPVIAAVHGYCLGGGIGLVGNADIIVASTDATFGLPEVDRGALGAATHLARLVPQHKMRAMVYTADARDRRGAARTTARSSRSSPRDELRAAARAVAAQIAAKSPTVIRAAKQSSTASIPWT